MLKIGMSVWKTAFIIGITNFCQLQEQCFQLGLNFLVWMTLLYGALTKGRGESMGWLKSKIQKLMQIFV